MNCKGSKYRNERVMSRDSVVFMTTAAEILHRALNCCVLTVCKETDRKVRVFDVFDYFWHNIHVLRSFNYLNDSDA